MSKYWDDKSLSVIVQQKTFKTEFFKSEHKLAILFCKKSLQRDNGKVTFISCSFNVTSSLTECPVPRFENFLLNYRFRVMGQVFYDCANEAQPMEQDVLDTNAGKQLY